MSENTHDPYAFARAHQESWELIEQVQEMEAEKPVLGRVVGIEATADSDDMLKNALLHQNRERKSQKHVADRQSARRATEKFYLDIARQAGTLDEYYGPELTD